MPQPRPGEQSEQPCIVCAYDLRHDPTGSCPECGATRIERDRLRALQGDIDRRQSQGILLTMGWIVLIAMLLSCLTGMLQVLADG